MFSFLPNLSGPVKLTLVIIVMMSILISIRQYSKSPPDTPLGSGAMFDKIAPFYDSANKYMSLGMDMSWRQQLVKKLELKEDDNILDLATGTGDVAILIGKAMASLSPKDYSIIGLDPSANMISFGKIKSKSEGLKISFMTGNSEDMSVFKDNSFTKITMSFGIRNVFNQRKALKEMYRVLKKHKKGSKLCIMEFCESKTTLLSYVTRGFLTYLLPFIGSFIARGHLDAYEHLRDSIINFPSPAEFLDILSDIGFTDCSVLNVFAGLVHIFTCTAFDSSIINMSVVDSSSHDSKEYMASNI